MEFFSKIFGLKNKPKFVTMKTEFGETVTLNLDNKFHRDQYEFYVRKSETIKKVYDSSIIGDTLEVAREKVKPIIVRVIKRDDGEELYEQSYCNGRCNVGIRNGIITEILHFG